jgi:glycogen operon protein
MWANMRFFLTLSALLVACAEVPGDDTEADTPTGDGLRIGHPRRGSFAPVQSSGWAAATWPQGAAFVAGEGSDLQVGVYSAHATRILLEIYPTATGSAAAYDYWMARGTDGIWRAQVAQVPGKTLYAFRAWGPNWPYDASWTRGGSSAGFIADVDAAGDRFDPNKVLLDPYARELTHDKSSQALVARGLDGKMYGTGGDLYQGVPRREFDTGPWAPKSVAMEDTGSFGQKPGIAAKDAIVYEAHVRGLSAHASSTTLTTLLAGVPGFDGVVDVPDACRGTYRAAGLMAPYLRGLGVNVVELLPVQESSNDTIATTAATKDANYWGYVTDGYFAPDRHYACDRTLGGPTAEFKAMVRAFHDAGLEVWLDVVYNHTGEGGNWDATKQVAELTSFRGFDNIDFYELSPSDPAAFFDTTGIGNNFNVTTDAGRRLVLDSLRYWTDEMGVDGFRFDEADELGRDAAPAFAFHPRAQLLLDIAAFAQAEGVKVVAEPWDLYSYGVGQFPDGWGEWNGRYRDASRRFLKGDPSGSGGVSYADAFYGDYNDYADQGGPARSINFIVAHDGFTLADLVSYDAKTNAARLWPFGPSDGGSDANDSWASGGDKALRRQRFRNFFVWQLFSRGVPMIVAGDELARTQNGNNNPFNLDTVATWNNYGMIATDGPQELATGAGGEAYHDNLGTDGHPDGRNGLFAFARHVIALRRDAAALRQGDYQMPIEFARSDGSSGFDSHADRTARIRIDGSAVGDSDYLLFVNMGTGVVDFTAPAPPAGQQWARIVDTAAWAEPNDNFWPEAAAWTLGASYGVQPWSIAVFKAVPAATPVAFHCDGCTTTWGQSVYVVGDAAALGAWSPAAALPLAPTAYPTWTGTALLPPGQTIAYKFIKVQGSAVVWEGGGNRSYVVPASGTGATGGSWQ